MDNTASVVQFLLYLHSQSRTWTNTNTESQKLKLSSLDTAEYVCKEREDRQCMYKHNTEARSRNHCCCGKAINIEYSECVPVASVIQHEMRVRLLYCHV